MLKVAGSGVTGALIYRGAWNASTNTPTLTSGIGTKGDYYVVSVAGSTNLDGITDWQVNDWAIFNGTVWQKVDGAILGTMAYQNANAVAITGGTIDGTTVGATTRSTGAFSTLDLTNALSLTNGGTGKTAATAALANLQGYTTTANVSFATTAASGDGTTATLTFAVQGSPPFAVGSTIYVAGVTPSGYNTATGALVTACTTSTVSYLNATSAAQTVAGTVTAAPVLTNTSSYYQLFTGTAIGGVVLPVASTLQQGWTYRIYNASSGGLTVYSSGGNSILAITPNAGGTFTCIDTTLNTAAAWRSSVSDFGALTGTSGSVVLSVSPTITGTLGFTGTSTSGANFASGQTTGSTNIVTIQTTGITTVGGTATTGALILGRSTGSQYIDIANGATASSTTASGTASSITTTVLTVGGTVTGTFVVGMQLTGTNVLPDTYITTLGTGTGGAGTYNISRSQTVASTTITGTTQKTISIGTNGVSGSSTVITLGSSVSGAVSRTYLNGIVVNSISAAVSAAGTTQATATPLVSNINNVTTVAASSGVVLPTAIAGMRIVVRNTGANALSIYPATGGTINALAANAAYSLATGTAIELFASTTTQWYTF
jgi:exosome complex RNA-binding protein Csl4